jgi:hypothetical protein
MLNRRVLNTSDNAGLSHFSAIQIFRHASTQSGPKPRSISCQFLIDRFDFIYMQNVEVSRNLAVTLGAKPRTLELETKSART